MASRSLATVESPDGPSGDASSCPTGFIHATTAAVSSNTATLFTTAADTARVDATVPAGANTRTLESHTCGFIRESARWFYHRTSAMIPALPPATARRPGT